MLAWGGRKNEITLWDVKSNKFIKKLAGHEDFVDKLYFTPKGKWLISCSWDGSAKILDIQEGSPLKTFKSKKLAITEHITTVALSKAKRLLITGSWNGTIEFWNVKTEKLLISLYPMVWMEEKTKKLIKTGWVLQSPDGAINCSKEAMTEVKYDSDKEFTLIKNKPHLLKPDLWQKIMGYR